MKRTFETRSLPTLIEQRNNLLNEMDQLVNTAKAETRAFSDEEAAKFDTIKKQIEGIDKTIKALEEARSFEPKEPAKEPETRSQEELEARAFENFLRGTETRADVNLTTGNNGAVIPTSIANKIIQKVLDISPIYQMATRYNVGGTLAIPYYDDSAGTITMAYADEFTELESTSGKFKAIELKGFLSGVLTKVSKSLINNSAFDIVSFVINKMAESISDWLEKELLNGTVGKIEGLSTLPASQTVTAASATALVADELIDLQEKLPDLYQANAVWIMNKATRTAIRKLKDADGNYLLNRDISARWGYTLLGKDVYTSKNVATIASGKTVVFYGDMSGLAVKLAEDINISVLLEKYATQHAVGVVGWLEADAKVEDVQKIAKLVMKV